MLVFVIWYILKTVFLIYASFCVDVTKEGEKSALEEFSFFLQKVLFLKIQA